MQQRVEPRGLEKFKANLRKLLKEFRAVQALDFFQALLGASLRKRLEGLEEKLSRLAGPPFAPGPKPASPFNKKDFQDRLWLTRKNPFVDRMASAWLIRRFIDPPARFDFLEPKRVYAPEAVRFDVPAGDFSHEQ